MTSLCEL